MEIWTLQNSHLRKIESKLDSAVEKGLPIRVFKGIYNTCGQLLNLTLQETVSTAALMDFYVEKHFMITDGAEILCCFYINFSSNIPFKRAKT